MILVTGGTGFVGRHVQEELASRGAPHAVFSSRQHDLTDWKQTADVFSAYSGADVVIHLACYQAAGDFPAKHPAEQLHLNSLIHVNVLEAWRRFLPSARLVAVGSSCAYPPNLMPLVEDRVLDGAADASVYAYAATKRLLLTGILAYNDQYKLNGSYLIPPTMFGEYDDFRLDTAHVCGALVGKFVRAVRERRPDVEIWGDGSQVREFLYAKDFVRALLSLSERIDRDVLNVGPGRGTTIRSLAETIADAAGFTGRLAFNVNRYVGVKEKYLTTTKMEQKYGVRLDGDLRAGLRRTVAWYSQHQEEFATAKFGAAAADRR